MLVANYYSPGQNSTLSIYVQKCYLKPVSTALRKRLTLSEAFDSLPPNSRVIGLATVFCCRRLLCSDISPGSTLLMRTAQSPLRKERAGGTSIELFVVMWDVQVPYHWLTIRLTGPPGHYIQEECV